MKTWHRVVLSFLLILLVGSAAVAAEMSKLTAPVPVAGESFGSAISVDDSVAIVGTTSGNRAMIYRLGDLGWTLERTLTSPGSATEFGRKVAIHGDTAVVADRFEYSGRGAVFVFLRNHGGTDNWGCLQTLTASDAQSNDYLGTSIDLTGEFVVAGATGVDDSVSGGGAVYVFSWNSGLGQFEEQKKIIPADLVGSDGFGWSIAVEGHSLIAGAYAQYSYTGAAYVFYRDEGGMMNWGQQAKLVSPGALTSDYFGMSVDIEMDNSLGFAIVGAFNQTSDGIIHAGQAHIYHRDEGGSNNWGFVKTLTADTVEVGDNFGTGVAIDGNRVVVGCPFDLYKDNPTGAIFLFDRNTGGTNNYGLVAHRRSYEAVPNGRFGMAVALSGDVILAGVPFDNNGSDAGSGSSWVIGWNNIAPVISDAPNAVINVGDTLTFDFTISDADDPDSILVFGFTSDNQASVPDSAISITGEAGTRTISIIARESYSGHSNLTFTVSDQESVSSDVVTIYINRPPVISAIDNVTIDEDNSAGPIAFTASDPESGTVGLEFSVASSDTSLVPVDNVVIGGSDGNYTVTVTPVPNGNGYSDITISVSDLDMESSETFRVTVTAVEDPPFFNGPDSIAMEENTPKYGTVLQVGDPDVSSVGYLTVTVTSLNTDLIPQGNIVTAIDGYSWIMHLTPATDAVGELGLKVEVYETSKPETVATDTIVVTIAGESGVGDLFSAMPERFSVAHVYPNPFNPVATVVVGLPGAAELNVQVYNMLGQRIATLADGQRSAGWQRLVFDGTHLASGLYIIRAASPQYGSDLKRIMLVH